MRKLMLLCSALLCGSLSAQNWALINPDYKYNYSNDGTDTISNQIFVTETMELGLDSMLYIMNPVAEFCSDCSGLASTCNTVPGLNTGQPQVFGLRATVISSDWTLFGSDTIRVLSDASPGASWTGPSGVEGTLTTATEQQVFGQPDSVKTIGFSNGSSMTISKAHGIISYGTIAEQFDLIGIQGAIEVGAYFPTIPDYFNYQPGDVLQYRSTDSGTDGLCIQNSVRTKKYVVVSRSELSNRTEYTMQVLANDQTWSSSIWGSGPCSGSHTTNAYEQVLGIEHDHWTADNFLGNNFLDHLWPKAFASPLRTGAFPGEFGSEYNGIQWSAHIDDQGRYTMEPPAVPLGQFGHPPAFTPCSGDSLFWPKGEDELTSRFVEGVGFTYGNYFMFEHDGETVLEGYRIAGEEVGTITPDDIILAVADKVSTALPLLAPNPADNHLLLTAVAPGTTCTILNLTGQVLLTRMTSSTSEHFDVSGLAPGVYILKMDGYGPQRFSVAR